MHLVKKSPTREAMEMETQAFLRVFEGATLTPVGPGVIKMGKPDQWIDSTMLAYIPLVGIVIAGDLCPGEHGVLSSRAYNLTWLKTAAGDYLAGKFLKKEWSHRVAYEATKAYLEEGESTPHVIRVLEDILERYDENGFIQYDDQAVLVDYLGDNVGMEYNVRDYALLQAISQKYAELST